MAILEPCSSGWTFLWDSYNFDYYIVYELLIESIYNGIFAHISYFMLVPCVKNVLMTFFHLRNPYQVYRPCII